MESETIGIIFVSIYEMNQIFPNIISELFTVVSLLSAVGDTNDLLSKTALVSSSVNGRILCIASWEGGGGGEGGFQKYLESRG